MEVSLAASQIPFPQSADPCSKKKREQKKKTRAREFIILFGFISLVLRLSGWGEREGQEEEKDRGFD